MKKIFTITFIFLVTHSFAQKCEVLNEFSAFHGFKFGSVFPDSIKKFTYSVPNSKFDKSYLLSPTISKNTVEFKNKLKSWLWVNGQFSDFFIYCLNDDRIYNIVLMKDFVVSDSLEFSKGHYPQFYENVTLELNKLFGGFTSEKINKNEIVGNSLVRKWDCDIVSVELTVCPNCASSFFSLSITNKIFESLKRLEEYKIQ